MIQINQELNVEDLIEEIEFAWCIKLDMNPKKAIELEVLYSILKKHFPQIEKYIDEQITTNNT